MSCSVHQTYIGDESLKSIGSHFGREMLSFSSVPGFTHRLWDNASIEDLLVSQYSHEVLSAYRSLIPPAYKSDLARAAIVNSFGGWYSDLANVLVNPDTLMVPDSIDSIFFEDTKQDAEYQHAIRNRPAIACGLFYSKPNSPVLVTIIDTIVENVGNKFYGETQWDITGPIVFGKTVYDMGLDVVSVGSYEPDDLGKRTFCLAGGIEVAKNKSIKKVDKFKSPVLDYGIQWANRNVYK